MDRMKNIHTNSPLTPEIQILKDLKHGYSEMFCFIRPWNVFFFFCFFPPLRIVCLGFVHFINLIPRQTTLIADVELLILNFTFSSYQFLKLCSAYFTSATDFI